MELGKTFTSTRQPWGVFNRNGHRVLCSDGKIRACEMAPTADTFFSVPASIRIAGKSITGYVTGEDAWDAANKVSYKAHSFHQHDGQEAKHLLPKWPANYGPDYLALVKMAY